CPSTFLLLGTRNRREDRHAMEQRVSRRLRTGHHYSTLVCDLWRRANVDRHQSLLSTHELAFASEPGGQQRYPRNHHDCSSFHCCRHCERYSRSCPEPSF